MRGIIDIDNHPGSLRYDSEFIGPNSFDYYRKSVLKPSKHTRNLDVEAQNKDNDDEVFNKYELESKALFI